MFAGEKGKITYTRYPSVDIHELVRRSQGGSILDEENLLAVCRKCHRDIGHFPHLAFALGLSVPGWAGEEALTQAERVRNSWARGISDKPEWMDEE